MNAKRFFLPLAAVCVALFASATATAQYTLYNQVLVLNGNDAYVNIPAATLGIPALSTKITAEAWIKTSVVNGDQAIIARFYNNSGSNTDDQFQLSVHNGRARWQISIGNQPYLIDGATVVADGTWHHVAGVYNGIHMAIVVDGAVDAPQIAVTGSLNRAPNTALRIGAAFNGVLNGYFFNGEIDEVRLSDVAFSATDLNRNKYYPLAQRSGLYPMRQVWRFNGPEDTGLGTLTPNAQLGVPSTPVPVSVDSYIRLDGDAEFVSLDSSSDLAAPVMTVEAWIRPLAIGTLQSVVSKYVHNSGTDADDAFFLGLEADGRPRFQVSVGNAYAFVNGPTNLMNNRWHHLAGVFDGQRIYLYVDEMDAVTTALVGSIPSNTSSLVYIGASREGVAGDNAHFFTGYIDDVRVWSRTFTKPEIVANSPSCWSDLRPNLMARILFEGDFINRTDMTPTRKYWGRAAGDAERMTFVGFRSFGQGSCH